MINHWKGLGSSGTVGLEIVVAIVLGLLAGRWADGRFHTAPYLTIAGFALGLVTAIKAVWRAWRDMQRETAREEREQGNPSPIFGPGSEGEPPSKPTSSETNDDER